MFGKKVAVFENKKLGGTCVNVGCVPKKVMYGVADFLDTVKLMHHGYGFSKLFSNVDSLYRYIFSYFQLPRFQKCERCLCKKTEQYLCKQS